MRALGAEAAEDGAVYFTGGVTAVLLGWRASTLDVDILLTPEQESVLRAVPRLKNELRVNVELASPRDFIPVPDGWEDRSVFAAREGRLSFYHFDPSTHWSSEGWSIPPAPWPTSTKLKTSSIGTRRS